MQTPGLWTSMDSIDNKFILSNETKTYSWWGPISGIFGACRII